uniref:PiggyBac transposable element-derived protein domain-containing protein n=1 Tax=Anopheles epiroticus TaxID=199890 RepID=A0A182PX04_9DIPT
MAKEWEEENYPQHSETQPTTSKALLSQEIDGNDRVDEDDDTFGWDDPYKMFDDMSLLDCLRYLAVANQLSRSVVNMILAILRKKFDADVPKDARTLVKTPTAVGEKNRNVEPRVTPFSLDVSTDGLPLHKSGPTQIWPILLKVVELPKLPVMTVAAFSGPSKPESIIPFLEPLIDELNLIQREGLVIGDKTPWRTPLEKLENFDMINGIVSIDRLHQIDEDVSRKILQGMINGKFLNNCENWTPPQKEAVSQILINIAFELHHHVRHLKYIAFWRRKPSFGPSIIISVTLKDFMTPQSFNFLLYFCGVTILSSSAHQHIWCRVDEFIRKFGKEFGTFYGREHITSNVHNLQHVYGEVAMYGPLDGFSAYPFESHLQQIKRWVRSGTKCAEQ